MDIEVGKFYKTRDGKKAFVYKEDNSNYPFLFVIVDSEPCYTCTTNGIYVTGRQSDLDLVEEWEGWKWILK